MSVEVLQRLYAGVRRVVMALKDEVSFDPRKVLVHSVSSLLPQFGFCRTRTALLRAIGLRVGKGSGILGPVTVTGRGDLTTLRIGERSYVSGPLRVDLGAADVRIGDRVALGHDVSLLTVDHDIGPPEKRCGRLLSASVSIGDGVWIASRAVVLPGVSIGSGAVVAAGAVVTHDVAPNALVAGIPARCIRDLSASEAPKSVRRQRTIPMAAAPRDRN